MNDMLGQLQEIFRDILDQPDLILTRESTAYTVEDWDSLAHVNIVTAVERRVQDQVRAERASISAQCRRHGRSGYDKDSCTLANSCGNSVGKRSISPQA